MLSDYRGILDTAIIGGGCAGLYCAWRLRETKHDAHIAVFEADHRIGGRLLSIDLPLPDVQEGSGFQKRSRTIEKAELGGMRLVRNQLLVANLICTLRKKRPQQYSAALHRKPFSFERQFMYLRSELISCKPENSEEQPGSYYGVSGHDPFEVMKEALLVALRNVEFSENHDHKLIDPIKQALKSPAFCKSLLSPERWAFIKQYGSLQGRPLYDLGLWNVLQHYLKPNQFLFIHDALGYESLIANWNFAHAIPVILSDFDKPRYYTLQGGMVTIPRALALEFERKETGLNGKPGMLALQSKVESVERLTKSGKSIFKILVRRTESSGSELREYEASNVIIALPKAALKSLQWKGFDEGQIASFHRHCDNVTGHNAFKLFLAFEEAWWRDKSLCTVKNKPNSMATPGLNTSDPFDFLRGRATTDFPIRQIYYRAQSEKGPAVIMASYSDAHYVDYWDPLVNDPHRDHYNFPLPYQCISPDIGEQLDKYRPSQPLVRKALRQLARIHGVLDEKDMPDEDRLRDRGKLYAAVVKEWKDAWHFWNVHTEPWKEIEYITQPFGKETAIYVCGEAFSSEQGWVEGALKSAELVLERIEGVSEPKFNEEMQTPDKFREYIRS